MSEVVVVDTGADPTEIDEYGEPVGEWEGDEEITDVTIADGVTEIKASAFYGCKGLTNLSFLKDSAITTVGQGAFEGSGIAALQGVKGVRKIGVAAFFECKDLRTIEGLGCEEMGEYCFFRCTLLQSMKGWPASMTVIPENCFYECTGMTTVDCDIAHVTSIGHHAFSGCTSLFPPWFSNKADPAEILAYLKRKSLDEPRSLRYATYVCVRRARAQEGQPRTIRSPHQIAFSIALLPKEMIREILEFAYGITQRL
jgi:hypothetical protein